LVYLLIIPPAPTVTKLNSHILMLTAHQYTAPSSYCTYVLFRVTSVYPSTSHSSPTRYTTLSWWLFFLHHL